LRWCKNHEWKDQRGFRGKAHLLQFGIYMFCLFACKWMENSEVMELFYVFFDTSQVLCALTVIDLVVLLCHSSYNLTMVRDLIFQRLSFIIYELWQGQISFLWYGGDLEIKGCHVTKTTRQQRAKSFWLKVWRWCNFVIRLVCCWGEECAQEILGDS